MLLSALVKILDIDESDNSSDLENLKAHLQDKQMLLVLDNFEQLIDASPLLAELLAAAPRLKMLVTSRMLLHLYGENEHILPHLALPNLKQSLSVEEISKYGSVALFVERAQASNPKFTLDESNARTVAEICIHLDGLPLAIELIAARVKFYSPQLMLSKWREQKSNFLTGGSRNQPVRHKSLQYTIDWSYNLLEPHLRHIFDQLAIFAAGFTLEAAQKVVTAIPDSPSEDLFKILTALVDNSLLIKSDGFEDEPSFKMLETIRQYALEHLEAKGLLTILQAKYANYYLQLAEEAEPHLTGVDQHIWLGHIDRELDNFRSVLAQTISNGEAFTALRISSTLGRFWVGKAYFSEGRRWLTTSLEKYYPFVDTTIMDLPGAKAVQMLALLTFRQGDFNQGQLLYKKALAIFERMQYQLGIADSAKGLGTIEYSQGNFDEAMLHYNRSLALYKALNHKQGIADLSNNIGILLDAIGQFEAATPLFEESLAIRRQIGSKQSIADSLNNLGSRLRGQGELGKAKPLLEESLALYREVDYKQGLPLPLINLANLLADLEDIESAKSLYLEAIDLLKEQDSRQYLIIALVGLGKLLHTQQHLDEALSTFEEGLVLANETGSNSDIAIIMNAMACVAIDKNEVSRAKKLHIDSLLLGRTMDHYFTKLENVEGLAAVAAREKQFRRSVYLFGIASASRAATGSVLNISSLRDERIVKDELVIGLGQETYNQIWNKAQSFTLEQAISYALEEIELE